MLMIFESIAHTSLPACPKFLLTIDRWIWLLIVLGPLIVIASLTHTNPLKRYLYTMICFSSDFFFLLYQNLCFLALITDCGYMIFHKDYLVILSVGWRKFDTLVPFKNGESQPFLRKFFKFVYKILTVFIKDLLSETLPGQTFFCCWSSFSGHTVLVYCYVAFAMVWQTYH